MRKVIQITGAAAGGDNECSSYLWALCDDGSIWRYASGDGYTSPRWIGVAAPPGCQGNVLPPQPDEFAGAPFLDELARVR